MNRSRGPIGIAAKKKLAELRQKFVLTDDEAQRFGRGREGTAVAVLSPTSVVIWMGDAQQTPFYRARRWRKFPKLTHL